MKARIVFASLLVSVATAPAFAAGPDQSDEGLPPNVAQHWKQVERAMTHGSPLVERTPAEVIRTQSIPATTYVGA